MTKQSDTANDEKLDAIRTLRDCQNYLSSLMADVIAGRVTTRDANRANRILGKRIKAFEDRLKG